MEGLELVHVHAFVDEVDERGEQGAVQAMAVQLARCRIRGGDQHDAAGEELLEQPAHDHGVGDVGHLKLVDTDERRVLGDLAGRASERIAGGLLTGAVNGLMGLDHELLEVDAVFLLRGTLSKNRSISMVLPRPTGPRDSPSCAVRCLRVTCASMPARRGWLGSRL